MQHGQTGSLLDQGHQREIVRRNSKE